MPKVCLFVWICGMILQFTCKNWINLFQSLLLLALLLNFLRYILMFTHSLQEPLGEVSNLVSQTPKSILEGNISLSKETMNLIDITFRNILKLSSVPISLNHCKLLACLAHFFFFFISRRTQVWGSLRCLAMLLPFRDANWLEKSHV